MQDSTGTYALGQQQSSANWTLEHLGSCLSAASSVSFSPDSGGSLGYGFVINGTLFAGTIYNSTAVNEAVNVTTGAVASTAYQLTGLSSSTQPGYYFSDFTYDPATDSLYAFLESATLNYRLVPDNPVADFA